jgi:hypothetical protein
MRLNDDVWGIIKLYCFPKHLWTLTENKNFFRTMKELPKIDNVFGRNRLVLIRNPKYYGISFVKVYEVLCWDYKSQTNRLFIESYITIRDNIDLLYIQNIPPLLAH